MTNKGVILLDTLIGLSVITVSLLSASSVLNQALSMTHNLKEHRDSYFNACNRISTFRAWGLVEEGDINETSYGRFYSTIVVGDIHFEVVQ